MSDVVEIGSAVRLGARRRELGVDGFESWVGETVVGRIPGARHEPE
ncbi:MAG: hypothetical protein H0U61_12200 [Nocardioidaceae bacterium]|nr:hypothetical protein [Nocardioidaceae bacterium]